MATWQPEVIQQTWNLILKGSGLRGVCFTTKHSCDPFCPQDVRYSGKRGILKALDKADLDPNVESGIY